MYSNYRGKSTGRVLQYIYIHCGLYYAERVVVAGSAISCNGEPFATVSWKKEGRIDVPVFEFTKKFDEYNTKQRHMRVMMQEDIVREQKHVIDVLFDHATFLYELSHMDCTDLETQRLRSLAGEFLASLG